MRVGDPAERLKQEGILEGTCKHTHLVVGRAEDLRVDTIEPEARGAKPLCLAHSKGHIVGVHSDTTDRERCCETVERRFVRKSDEVP